MTVPLTAVTRVDAHLHIIDPARFAFARETRFIPAPSRCGTAEDLAALQAQHGFDRALLAQPSCYGFDNAAMLDAMAQAQGRWAGIAVVPLTMSAADMRKLAACGVIGVRFNLVSFDADALADPAVDAFLDRCDDLGWWVEVMAPGSAWTRLGERFARRDTRLLIDHFGVPDPAAGIGQPGFRAVLDLARFPRTVVKLSAPYRVSRQPAPYVDLIPYAAALLSAYGAGRLVWGSDWPFINFPEQPRYDSLLAAFDRLVPDAADRAAILATTPLRLFGFACV